MSKLAFGFYKNLQISLEYIYSNEYSNNKEFIFKDGDCVTFVVDKFDVVI